MAANIFNSVKGLHPKRNKFSADTYRNDFTAPLGANIPVFMLHTTPAMRVKCDTAALVRLQALIAPVMDNIDYYVHFWKIPYRLLENDRFTAFISGEMEAEDYDALFVTPNELASNVILALNVQVMTYENKEKLYFAIFGNGSLFDFLGYDLLLFPKVKRFSDQSEDLDIDSTYVGNTTTDFNFRPLIAYYMLHSNWYMNENVPYFDDFLEDVDRLVKTQSLAALVDLLIHSAKMDISYKYSFLPHAWEKDYFTSALPNVQSGDPVTLPIGGTAPVVLDSGGATAITIGGVSPSVGLVALSKNNLHFSIGNEDLFVHPQQASQAAEILVYQEDEDSEGSEAPIGGISGTLRTPLQGTADLSEATAITINELRFANALQVFKERQLRFGKRRQEYYKGFFDVEPEDLRLQIPKYLGGGRIPINISDIEQTSATSGSSALGHLAGKATAVAGGFAGFSTFCSEESIIIGIAFAMPHVTYANFVSRFLLKTNDIYDYFNPSFEHLGEQAIKNIEVFAGATNPDGDFGYTPRYTEYRFHFNEMHGSFKDSLSFWSLGRIFETQPALNPKFIYMQSSAFDRIFAVSGQPNMVVSMIFHVRSIKPVSKYGTPMLLA